MNINHVTDDISTAGGAAPTLGGSAISTFGASLIDDADAAAARTTLAIERSGTFTPVFADAISGGNEATAGTASGDYIETDNFVDIFINLSNIDTTGLTGTNVCYITGIPYPVATLSTAFARAIGGCTLNQFTATANGLDVVCEAASSLGVLILRETLSNNSIGNAVLVNQFASGTADLFISIRYPK